MNKDFETEYDMVFDRAVLKSYNKMSYWEAAKHLFQTYRFQKSSVYKGIISRRQAGIFREMQVSKLVIRGNGVKKISNRGEGFLKYNLFLKNYLRNMWFGWSVHWQDATDKNPLVRLRYRLYHLCK